MERLLTIEKPTFCLKTGEQCYIPKCAECGAPMKPHCMFFDEHYVQHYYGNLTVDAFLKKADCALVVGTALESGYARKIVGKMLE